MFSVGYVGCVGSISVSSWLSEDVNRLLEGPWPESSRCQSAVTIARDLVHLSVWRRGDLKLFGTNVSSNKFELGLDAR